LILDKCQKDPYPAFKILLLLDSNLAENGLNPQSWFKISLY